VNGKFWLTATPPTPNGELHLGHLAGPYVAVDVLRRALIADGCEVVMTTGLDDYQSYVPVRGLADGKTGEEVADHYGAKIVSAWWQAGVEFDRVVEPRATAGYQKFVQSFFAKLVADGAIVPRTMPLPYCEPCGRWLYEAYVVGGCPHCGASSNGNACEPCGRPNTCGDLIDPHCVLCGAAAELRDNTRLFLPLSPFADRLRDYWSTVDMPPHVWSLCETMLADGLPDIAVSHPGDWGVPVPVTGFTDHRIYVWFEMAPGYLLEVDKADTPPVQFFGFDNSYFHAVLFPVCFMAWGEDAPLAKAFVVNEFYRYEGKKFSTSRRHAVWALEMLAEAGADVVRMHVLGDRPNGRQTSFSRNDMAYVRDHLEIGWNGWLRRLLEAVQKESGGSYPGWEPAGPQWELLRDRVLRTIGELREAYSVAGFDARRAVALLDEIVKMAADFGYVHEHSKDRPGGTEAYHSALAAQLHVAVALAAVAHPVMPNGSARLSEVLGVPPGRPVTVAALAAPPAGAELTSPQGPIFGG
jgi:methionyl-tRNA synthetase